MLYLALPRSTKMTTCNTLHIPVEPAPASRPKVNRFGVTYAKSHLAYVRAATPYVEIVTDLQYYESGILSVSIEFVCTKAKTSKLITPRYDIDNLVKLPLDIMTKTGNFWRDDVQIAEIHAMKRFALPDEQAGTTISYSLLEE